MTKWFAGSRRGDHQVSTCLTVVLIAERKILILLLLDDRAFGTNRWFQDGLKENYHILEKFLQYSHDQHLAKKVWKPEDVRSCFIRGKE